MPAGPTRSVLMMCLALWMSLAGCARAPSDDVRIKVDGAHLVIENRTGADIHHFISLQSTGGRDDRIWIPISLPDNRLETGRRLRVRIPPSQRGNAVGVSWWRPGAQLANSNFRGADMVRKTWLPLAELAEPMPVDEQVVRACMTLHELVRRNDSERECMTQADDCLLGRDCEQELANIQLMIESKRQQFKGRG